jgi:hypothetical protein
MIDKQSLVKKSLELPLGSPLTFFIQILPPLMLSKFKVFTWFGNGLNIFKVAFSYNPVSQALL